MKSYSEYLRDREANASRVVGQIPELSKFVNIVDEFFKELIKKGKTPSYFRTIKTPYTLKEDSENEVTRELYFLKEYEYILKVYFEIFDFTYAIENSSTSNHYNVYTISITHEQK